MLLAKGKYNEAKIYSDRFDENAYSQIIELCNNNLFKDSKIRIMPDYHAGKGCVVGFTANLSKLEVIPNIIGVDIGCGVFVYRLGKIDIDYIKLDEFIRNNIPSGMSVNNKVSTKYDLSVLKCYSKLINIQRIENSLGTLGGGNHFIEIDVDASDNKYLIIHSGSRNLGKQVCDIYQKQAYDDLHNRKDDIAELIKNTPPKDRERVLRDFKAQTPIIKTGLESLKDRKSVMDYLHDMDYCVNWAKLNRKEIALKILGHLFVSYNPQKQFESVHNYIEYRDKADVFTGIFVRKGAISALKNQLCIIPMNMRDGSLICIGKGNPEWNYSAPHGAGRLMSRGQAKELVDLDEYKYSMRNIYSSSVNQSTIDESPMAYKPMDEIVNQIQETVEIVKIVKPVYNFKAGE